MSVLFLLMLALIANWGWETVIVIFDTFKVGILVILKVVAKWNILKCRDSLFEILKCIVKFRWRYISGLLLGFLVSLLVFLKISLYQLIMFIIVDRFSVTTAKISSFSHGEVWLHRCHYLLYNLNFFWCDERPRFRRYLNWRRNVHVYRAIKVIILWINLHKIVEFGGKRGKTGSCLVVASWRSQEILTHQWEWIVKIFDFFHATDILEIWP